MQMIVLAALQQNKNKRSRDIKKSWPGCNKVVWSSDLDELPVAVLRRRPGVVFVVEAGLSRHPAAVVEERGGADLVVADLPRLHTQRDAAAQRYEEAAGKKTTTM